MKTYIRNILIILLSILVFPKLVTYGQVTISTSVMANGGGEMTGSHTLTGTFGQPITGTSGTTLTAGFWNPSMIITGVIDNTVNTIPKEYKLDQNYPNPFNPSTVISFQLPAFSKVSLKIYDVLGREVITLLNEEKPAGNYKVNFDASELSSGVYFYRISAIGKGINFVKTKKMILIK